MNNPRPLGALLLCAALALAAPAHAFGLTGFVGQVVRTAHASSAHSADTSPVRAEPDGTIEVGFSPEGTGEALVIKTINSARSQIRVLAYSFTSANVTRALLAAKHRGVNVAVVADYKNNVLQDKSGKARAALSALVNAGVPVRLVSKYPIFHDKTVVADSRTVETGSFNYSEAAAHKNSENVLVLWGNPQVASTYLKHWNARYAEGSDYQTRY
jgi:phosphatidylserine/phosphatidylglycerophosphate/cardiolipin synthase-like enzyme